MGRREIGSMLAVLALAAWTAAEGGRTMTMELTSAAFRDGGAIPRQYTCDGEDVSPPLSWRGVPEGSRSLALIVDDPDAPKKTWVHWVVFNVPSDSGGLPENVPADPRLASGARQGVTDFGRLGYGGPCPPGGTHRYFFKLYALDAELDLDPGATKQDVLRAMQGHVLGEAQLMGTYRR